VKYLKAVPAGRLLLIMNRGYSRALGVRCTHCHDENNFASDDKRPKRAAREMAAMHRTINDTLRGMTNLEDDPQKRAINCSTCHRGSIDPRATDR
jgi:cytochrome c553